MQSKFVRENYTSSGNGNLSIPRSRLGDAQAHAQTTDLRNCLLPVRRNDTLAL